MFGTQKQYCMQLIVTKDPGSKTLNTVTARTVFCRMGGGGLYYADCFRGYICNFQEKGNGFLKCILCLQIGIQDKSLLFLWGGAAAALAYKN